jgi:hypothetical protein
MARATEQQASDVQIVPALAPHTDNSPRAVLLRRQANTRIRHILTKGYSLAASRLTISLGLVSSTDRRFVWQPYARQLRRQMPCALAGRVCADRAPILEEDRAMAREALVSGRVTLLPPPQLPAGRCVRSQHANGGACAQRWRRLRPPLTKIGACRAAAQKHALDNFFERLL